MSTLNKNWDGALLDELGQIGGGGPLLVFIFN